MVGELRPPPSSSSASDQPGAPALDPYEYRRYAMISKTLLTPGATKTPVYKFKFSLLYPFANSTGQQSPPYLPGQAVEIQARIDGQLVSRYYTAFEATPGSGDGVLECTIKIYPNSKMGNWLIRQREGDRQIKIRGPLGREILSTVPRWTPEGGNPTGRVIFFAGGTGILPFTQLLRAWVMLSSPTLGLVAASEYTPTLADELDIQPGDTIVPHHHYYDGWCVGTNLRTNATGAFPLSATYPPLTTPLVLVHSCSSPEDFATAGPEIEGAVLAWPGCIQVIRLTDDRVGKERVQQVVGNGEGVERIVVCGPQGFVDTVVESVEGLCGTTVGVEVLPHDRIVE
ncbi:hypothetical protein HK104_000992 [Borealophlyctis nickersoniae]|nr:hypothetical protein HK104_000992 [Borealophlyctis nickersoniae]